MKNKKKKLQKPIEDRNFFESIPKQYRDFIAVVIILLPLLYYFVPYLVNNVEPSGSDYLASVAQKQLYMDWAKESGETALWNPSIFGGEPIYPRITPKLFHIDTLLSYFGKLFYWAFWYLLFGGWGIYFLLRYKKIPWYSSIIVALVFVLLPDWQALIGEGHNSKIRALMVIPWFILSFSYFFDKKNWISTGLFALTFLWYFNTFFHLYIPCYRIID